MKTPQQMLDELRWKPDQIVMSPTYGELVWLKQIQGGLTDCCAAVAPCDYHAKIHAAPASFQ